MFSEVTQPFHEDNIPFDKLNLRACKIIEGERKRK